ncbi:tetratricopeptide repeat protein [Sphingomonas sp. DT-51]|uniref:tetratricopeptide repeat protein n=1 Tax=Sphingomonas sp. DT-51 TaxID=3396165 RepID=UPI003F1C23CA
MNRVLMLAVLGLALLVAAITQLVVPAAATNDGAARVQDAGRHAARARDALAHRRWPRAIAESERAVADSPLDGEYRRLLGVSYLRAGRFVSAAQAFADALTLRPDDSAAALNLSLAQVATGEGDTARVTLATHASGIGATDRGLALALAGDLPGALQLLMPAARAPDADAKTRQNLAFVLALAGQWPQARALAAYDLPADQVDRRLTGWAALAQQRAASDQVAALLGIIPASDPGQPAALALVAPAPAAIVRMADPRPSVTSQIVPAPVAPASSQPVPPPASELAAPAAVPTMAGPTVAPHPLLRVAAVLRSRPPARGRYFVQLGAYGSVAVARDGWRGAVRRWPALGQWRPMRLKVTGAMTRYQLSIGGVSRGDAIRLCRVYRARGGRCFVRLVAGDRPAPWRERRLAMR